MSAFQSSAFQRNAFQMLTAGGAIPPSVPPIGGGSRKQDSYALPYARHLDEEYHRKQREALQLIDKEIADAEALKLEKLAEARLIKSNRQAKKAALELAALETALEAEFQAQISALRMEQVRLMRFMDDEEAVLALLLSLPLH